MVRQPYHEKVTLSIPSDHGHLAMLFPDALYTHFLDTFLTAFGAFPMAF